MNVYEGAAINVLNKINEFGRSVTINSPASDDLPVFNPQDFSFSEGGEDSQVVSAMFTRFDIKEIDGTAIKRDDKRLLIPAEGLDLELSTDSTITDGSDTYQVISFQELKPASKTVMYTVQVRK